MLLFRRDDVCTLSTMIEVISGSITDHLFGDGRRWGYYDGCDSLARYTPVSPGAGSYQRLTYDIAPITVPQLVAKRGQMAIS